jgi:hypothetical protein
MHDDMYTLHVKIIAFKELSVSSLILVRQQIFKEPPSIS